MCVMVSFSVSELPHPYQFRLKKNAAANLLKGLMLYVIAYEFNCSFVRGKNVVFLFF